MLWYIKCHTVFWWILLLFVNDKCKRLSSIFFCHSFLLFWFMFQWSCFVYPYCGFLCCPLIAILSLSFLGFLCFYWDWCQYWYELQLRWYSPKIEIILHLGIRNWKITLMQKSQRAHNRYWYLNKNISDFTMQSIKCASETILNRPK